VVVPHVPLTSYSVPVRAIVYSVVSKRKLLSLWLFAMSAGPWLTEEHGYGIQSARLDHKLHGMLGGIVHM
jgi:hypothetical protein